MPFNKTFHFFTLVIILCLKPSFGYRKYYIEDECIPSDDKQKIILKVPEKGPDSVGEIRSNRFGTYSRLERHCLVKLQPPDGYGIVITLLNIDFRDTRCRDYIKIKTNDDKTEKLCGNQRFGLNETYYSAEDLEILYHTSGSGMGFNKGVRLVFTVTKIDLQCSNPDQFKCKNSRCIWAGVTCDGINNCGDASDENAWDYPFCRTYPTSKSIFSILDQVTPITVIVTVLGVASVVAVMVGMCVCCCRKDIKQPEKPILFGNHHGVPNGGYIPIPGYNYGSISNIPRHMQPIHSQTPPAVPARHGWANSNVALVHHKYLYERPPPYGS